ncbi:MAG TPA: rod shape-determining protein MreD [Arenimonas sp.]|nr:rod shape-determining protein MreD [Arenimonas sp.]
MIRRDTPGLRWISIALAFFIMIIPMAEWLAALRPSVLALVMMFWILETPRKMGLGRVFLIGLLLDLTSFAMLGEHAFRLLLMAGVVHQLRNQFRFYPIWQQSLFVLAILYVDLIVLSLLRLFQGLPQPAIEAWISPVLAFLIWPWLYMFLDNLRLQSRSK